MSFEVLNLPGHTRCSVGYYCREKKLLLSSETLGVYDGERTIVPSYLVSYADSIASVERVEKLEISRILAPHYGILSQEQTKFFLDNMKLASEKTALNILNSLKKGKSTDEIIAEFKAEFWHGYIREIYPEDAVNLNTSIMTELVRKELM